MIQFRRPVRLGKTANRLPFPFAVWPPSRFLKHNLARVMRAMAPTLVALTFAGVAHAQGTMDFSGAQTLMGTFKTFAVYAGAVICFGGLIFAGIRMMSGRFQFLVIDTIHESTTNPRQTFEQGKLEELVESIRQHGLIQPITVRPNASGFEIVAGARRFRAAQLAEVFSLPARIVELNEAQAMEWQLVELSIVGKSFHCLQAAWYVVYM
jgi:hypothetical protein